MSEATNNPANNIRPERPRRIHNRLNNSPVWSENGKRAISNHNQFTQTENEPIIEFRDCKRFIIDFIKRNDEIYLAQNYLYCPDILEALSRKKIVCGVVQYQPWMREPQNQHAWKVENIDKYFLMPNFHIEAILENISHNTGRILHHKMLVGFRGNPEENNEKMEALYGTYNITGAASGNFESMMLFKSNTNPITCFKIYSEIMSLCQLADHQFNYRSWFNAGKPDPYRTIDRTNQFESYLHESEETEYARKVAKELIDKVIKGTDYKNQPAEKRREIQKSLYLGLLKAMDSSIPSNKLAIEAIERLFSD